MLQKLLNKKSKTVIGLLSGTSVDAIDAVLVKISGSHNKTRIKVIDFLEYPIDEKVRNAVLQNSSADTANIKDICRLNVILGKLFSEAVIKLCDKNRIKLHKIDLIGSHGQTIHHLPNSDNYLGYDIKSTLQIGDPSIISNITGITTVGDFRIADCAAGGDGAPLVPYLDYILFQSRSYNRALLNIGGIANITALKKNCKKEEVIAFDTGPGNMLIDGISQKLFNVKYDKDGKLAAKGKLDNELFNILSSDDYYKMHYPKSTGRERYGADYLNMIFMNSEGLSDNDILRTVTEFTAYTIWYNYKQLISDKISIKEMLVSGGGAHNKHLMNSLKNYFKGIRIKKTETGGINADNKEAVLFAVLANECISSIPANMMQVTGSNKDVILGKICPGLNK